MIRPRLIYYNDAHHFHAKRLEPPASIHKLQWPVDELLGTGVELLVFGLGYSDVYFHDSNIGRVVGQKKEVWENYIDWRIMRMVQDARRMGTDQLREVLARGREMGLPVFPSLKLNDPSKPGDERCGRLKWEHGAEVCLREPDDTLPGTEWCYDYTLESVRRDKLAMIKEVVADYRADGIELDFTFRPRYFRKSEVEENIPLMTAFVAEVKELVRGIGAEQGREVPVMARVHASREQNLDRGLDVEAWLDEGSVDLVAGELPGSFLDTGPRASWLADAANRSGAAAYIRPPRRVYDERTATPAIEMYRALGQTLRGQGFAGMYLGYLPWPLGETEYQVLREAAYPEVHARKDKRYFLQPGDTASPGQVPAALEEGKTVSVAVFVADDVDGARTDGEMRNPVLTMRFSFYCIEDEIAYRFNGKVLPIEDFEITDERALRIPSAESSPGSAPAGFSAHWFRYRLDVDDVVLGENTLEIEVRRLEASAGFARSLNGVEIHMRYKDFVRPEGLAVSRVAPLP